MPLNNEKVAFAGRKLFSYQKHSYETPYKGIFSHSKHMRCNYIDRWQKIQYFSIIYIIDWLTITLRVLFL